MFNIISDVSGAILEDFIVWFGAFFRVISAKIEKFISPSNGPKFKNYEKGSSQMMSY